jgi:pSer/pThr/pTyr-binding forkhead associated (FHA) protein
VVLHQAASVIGRTSGSSVADVDCGGADTGVSRKHARVALGADGGWTVTDLGSTNGTFLGTANTRLTPQAETPLEASGVIKIGAYTVIRLEPGPET